MALSSQQTYLDQAVRVQSLWNQWLDLYAAVRKIDGLIASGGAEYAWKAMSTSAQNPDGSLGAADDAPVASDPISVVNPSTGRPLGMSADDLINARNDLLLLAGLFDGTATLATAVDHSDDAPSVTTAAG